MLKNIVTSYSKVAFFYLGSSVFASIINVAINPFVAKNLSPNDYAIIGYFTSFQLLILPIISFNLVTFYMKNYYQIPEEKRVIVGDTILIASLIYGFFALIVCYLFFYIYFFYSGISFSFFPYAILAFVPVWLSGILNFRLVECRLTRNAKKYAGITILNAIINAVFTILIVVIFKYGATGKLTAALVSSVIIAAISWEGSFHKWQIDYSTIKQAFKFSYPLTLSGILWYFFSNVDRAFLAPLNDNNLFGIYNVGLQMAGLLTVFYSALAQTFEPDIFKAIADKNNRKLFSIVIGIFVINAIPNLLFIPFAPFIIGILTSNRYVASSAFAEIFVLKNISMALYYLLVMVIIGYGHTKVEFLIRLLGTGVSIILLKLLINKYFFYGAAWSQVFSFIILSVLLTIYLISNRRKILINESNRKK
jgi:O-antigen/teichoic acid export membrane protein